MMPKNMWDLLLKYKIYVLAIGDPEQLPPVDPEQFNGVLDHPHVFLDEIVRQAQDSEIIRLSMWIREGKSLKSYNGTKEQIQIFKPNELIDGMYYWADQILCATNKKKLQINNFIRKQQGKSIYPEIGDKVISLHNHWNEFSKCKICPLTNGTIGEIKQFYVNTVNLPPYISNNSVDYMMTNIEIDDNDYFEDIPIDYTGILKGIPSLTSEQEYLLKKDKRYPDPPFYFDYAYAITVHKAQGSEWDKILIIEESFPFDKIEHKQWLYTAITRAREKVVIIEK